MYFKHGHNRKGAASSTYRCWVSMLGRCRNPKDPRYATYGGRGVVVDLRWYEFCNFLADMGERPEGTTLDRIDNKKGYCPGNCRWATPKEQARNRSSNRYITWKGETLLAVEWAERLGMSYKAFHNRLQAWPLEDVFSVPYAKRRRGV